MLPISLGPLIGDFVLSDYGYRELFWVLGGLGFVALFASLFIPETRPVDAEPPSGMMKAMSLRTNDFLSGMFAAVGIRLVDFKLEFGRHYENDMVRTILADEISPDTCRLWDIKTDNKLDKDRFRKDLGGLVEAYQEVASRLGIMNKSEPQKGAKPVLVKSDRSDNVTQVENS